MRRRDTLVKEDFSTPETWYAPLKEARAASVAPVVKQALTMLQPAPTPVKQEDADSKYSSKNNIDSDVAKLLVVDDSPTARHYMTLKLRPYGIDIDYAEDGETAIELAKKHNYICIFLDVMMPGIDGYEACKRMRKELNIKTPIVIITSKDSAFDKLKGQVSGCSAYLTKPLDETALLETASRFIRH